MLSCSGRQNSRWAGRKRCPPRRLTGSVLGDRVERNRAAEGVRVEAVDSVAHAVERARVDQRQGRQVVMQTLGDQLVEDLTLSSGTGLLRVTDHLEQLGVVVTEALGVRRVEERGDEVVRVGEVSAPAEHVDRVITGEVVLEVDAPLFSVQLSVDADVSQVADHGFGAVTWGGVVRTRDGHVPELGVEAVRETRFGQQLTGTDRKSTRLNSSHVAKSCAGTCWKE